MLRNTGVMLGFAVSSLAVRNCHTVELGHRFKVVKQYKTLFMAYMLVVKGS